MVSPSQNYENVFSAGECWLSFMKQPNKEEEVDGIGMFFPDSDHNKPISHWAWKNLKASLSLVSSSETSKFVIASQSVVPVTWELVCFLLLQRPGNQELTPVLLC